MKKKITNHRYEDFNQEDFRLNPDPSTRNPHTSTLIPHNQMENIMCESNVYLKENGTEKLIMENVAAITPAGENQFILKGLLGEQQQVSGIIENINLMGHKIILKAV